MDNQKMTQQKIDILAFSAHPDDAELAAGGTLLLQKSKGNTTGIIDLTHGDLGTRGTVEERRQEAKDASAILQLDIRENLGFRDGFFQNDEAHQLEVIKIIRKYRPNVVIANAPSDRHPDHGRASALVSEAAFYAGLRKIETFDEQGNPQEAWRPGNVLFYIQFWSLKPDVFVDITPFMNLKIEAIKAHKSQFHNPNSGEPETVISSKHFLDNISERASDWGRLSGCRFAEAFIFQRAPRIDDITQLK
jgi:bacillithiol biosynthesis deacetylase BshB1